MADRRKHGVRVLRSSPAPEGKLEVVVGRGPSADLRIDSPRMSRATPGCGAAAAGCVMALLRFRRP